MSRGPSQAPPTLHKSPRDDFLGTSWWPGVMARSWASVVKIEVRNGAPTRGMAFVAVRGPEVVGSQRPRSGARWHFERLSSRDQMHPRSTPFGSAIDLGPIHATYVVTHCVPRSRPRILRWPSFEHSKLGTVEDPGAAPWWFGGVLGVFLKAPQAAGADIST